MMIGYLYIYLQFKMNNITYNESSQIIYFKLQIQFNLTNFQLRKQVKTFLYRSYTFFFECVIKLKLCKKFIIK